MISRAKNFIFVHVPKTAGNSVQNALFPYSEDERTVEGEQDGVERFGVVHPGTGLWKHSRMSDYQQALDPAFFDAALKITVLRNPWDRMISTYFYWDERAAVQAGHAADPDLDLDEASFRELVGKSFGYRGHICARDRDGALRRIDQHSIDVFLRFEHLQDDMDALADRLGIARVQLVQRNASRHRPYASYYTDSLRDAVAERFAREIEYFGFSFDLPGQGVAGPVGAG